MSTASSKRRPAGRVLRRYALRHAVAGALALLLGACGGGGGERLAQRLIAEDPQILLPRDDLFLAQPAFAWSFTSAEDLAPWQVEAAGAELSELGWRLRPQEGVVRLSRQVTGGDAGAAFDAAELHELEIELSGLGSGKATLFWAGPGELFDPARSLEGSLDRSGGAAVRSFELASHPAWGGELERLRLDLQGLDSSVELRAVRGARHVLQAETLAARLGESWKLDIDADVRNAWLALPGVDTERRLTIGENQRLAISYALEPAVQQAIEFVVSGKDAGDETELWSRQLAPADAGRWHEARIDLSRFAGRELKLRFETRSATTPDLARGFPVWANPELLEPAAGEEQLPNVILISLDTLRADRMSAYGHERPTTPNIERWAARSGVLFENAVAQAPWTLPSHASMFTGLEALRHDVNHFGEAPESLEMLAETLRGAGYSTAAITGGGYLRPQFGFAQGFDVFRYWPHILAEQEFAEGSERLVDWLRANRSRRFFMLFHTYEVHFPFRRRQPFFDRYRAGQPDDEVRGEIGLRARPMEPGDVQWQHDYFTVTLPSGEQVEHLNDQEKTLLRAMYDSGIAYVDEELGRLFAELRRLGLEEKTLVIITSDHGEALGEGDRGGHNYLYDWNVMVPLIIAFPDGFGAGRRVEQQVRSIDIVPTVLETLGLEEPRPLDGVSLRQLIAGGAAASPEEAWTYASSANFGLGLRHRNQLKYVFDNTAWSPYLGTQELYDLRRDPAELSDVSADDPAAERLRSRVQRAMDEQHEGVRLQIRNGGERGVLRGRLKGAWAHHSRVKSSDADCQCLRWQRGALFSLEAGQSVTLYFEAIPGTEVGFEGTFESAGAATPLDESFDLQQLERPVVVALEDTGWRRFEGSAPPDVGFRLWNAGQRPKARAPGPRDRETLEQLEALGYIDP